MAFFFIVNNTIIPFIALMGISFSSFGVNCTTYIATFLCIAYSTLLILFNFNTIQFYLGEIVLHNQYFTIVLRTI